MHALDTSTSPLPGCLFFDYLEELKLLPFATPVDMWISPHTYDTYYIVLIHLCITLLHTCA